MLESFTEKSKWKSILNKFESYDLYHTYDYHFISKKADETPILIVYSHGNIMIALPLLIRKISNSNYYDATSVWGYAGPLQNGISNDFNNSKFKEQLNDYFLRNNIISVFSRLNPFVPYQNIILNNIGSINEIHKVVNIDLTKTLEEQRAIFSKTTKRYLNKYKKLFEFRISHEKKDINSFKELYYENMDRVNAKEDYYYKDEYFNDFLNNSDFKADLILATLKETNQIVSGAIMTKTNNIIQYHISGTKTEYLHLTPIRHIIDEIRIKSTIDNYTFFNLGGGLGNYDDDLFRFKSSFSKDFKPFTIWKYIVNEIAYTNLVKERVNDSREFFPAYRCD